MEYWINTVDYSIPALITNGIGCIFWVITYAVIVYEIIKKKFVEMPVFVAAANLAWEMDWSIFFHPDTGILYSLSYQGAFLLDIYIFWNVLKYGTKQIEGMSESFKKYFKPMMVFNLLAWIVICYFFAAEGYDTKIGANSGYILNLMISVLYIVLIFSMKDLSGFSVLVAWCKMLGTGLITVSMFLIYPNNHFVQTLGVLCLILDCLYIHFLTQRKNAY
jgi:hypothetical protein